MKKKRGTTYDTDIGPTAGPPKMSDREIEALMGLLDDPWLMEEVQSVRSERMGASFNGIVSRLEDDGLIRRGYLPSLWMLGGDILSLTVTTIPSISLLDPDGICSDDLFPFRMIKAGDQDTHLCLGVFPDFTYYNSTFSRWKHGISGSKFQIDLHTTWMPCTMLHFHDLLSFEGIFARLYGIERSGEGGLHDIIFHDRSEHLSHHDKILLGRIVQYPGLSHLALAERSGINRQSISKFKAHALETGMLHPLVTPDLKRFGLDVMAVIQMELDGFHRKDKDEVLAEIAKDLRGFSFFNLSSLDNQMIITAHRDFGEFQSDLRFLLKRYDEEEILRGPPHVSALEMPTDFKPGMETFNEKYF